MSRATTLDDICHVIGYTAACALATWYGGKRLYVPGAAVVAGRVHPLARVIGEPALRALVREWPGEHLAVPHARTADRMARDRRLCELAAEGASVAAMAIALGLSTRRVGQLLAELQARGWLAHAGGALHVAVGPGAR
jgi:hypothetical protein